MTGFESPVCFSTWIDWPMITGQNAYYVRVLIRYRFMPLAHKYLNKDQIQADDFLMTTVRQRCIYCRNVCSLQYLFMKIQTITSTLVLISESNLVFWGVNVTRARDASN